MLGLYFPITHVVHAVEPATDTCVLEHNAHVEDAVAPGTLENVSTGHSVHTALASGAVVYVPEVHVTQSDSSVRASWSSVDFPAPHGKQLPILLLPVLMEYLPATQLTHAALPVSILYFPATHCIHVPPSDPVAPALQMQLESVPLPAGDCEFATHPTHAFEVSPLAVEYWLIKQSVHPTLPVVVLYFPATHSTHTPPLGPVAPWLQMQLAGVPLPIGDCEFAPHGEQVFDVASTIVEYWLATQSVQVAAPLSILYFPATQPLHVCPLGPVNPALHEQSFTASLATGASEFDGQFWHVSIMAAVDVENLPLTQSVHGSVPLAVLYFPATQPVHVPPFGPVNPALHEQSLDSPLRAGAWELVVHGVHSSSPSMENVFGPQESQLSMVREALTGEK